MKTRLLRTTLFALCLAQPALGHQSLVAAPSVAATPSNLSVEQWREDLYFMAREMERLHKSLYHSVSREAFAAAIADLDARLPGLQRHEVIVGIMRIVAMVGDGHTNVSPLKDTRF